MSCLLRGTQKTLHSVKNQHSNGKFTIEDVFPIENGDFPMSC